MNNNTISEDSTVIMLPDGVNEVRHAGNTYAYANTFHGRRNTNESGSFENGYRHVWDFGTDRANGTIKCLSPISQYGGICEYRNVQDGNDKTYVSCAYYYFNADKAFQTFNYDRSYIICGSVDGSGNGDQAASEKA